MRSVFVDTLYLYGFANPRDPWHIPVQRVRAQLGSVHLVTTEEVLVEFLTSTAGGGKFMRQAGVQLVQSILNDETAQVLPQTHESFLRGLDLYARRLDKEYSLVDCISMTAMREAGITDILTNDHHFTQEGFNALIQRP